MGHIRMGEGGGPVHLWRRKKSRSQEDRKSGRQEVRKTGSQEDTRRHKKTQEDQDGRPGGSREA